MNEKEILLSRLSDLKEKAADESVITYSNFLSVDERNIAVTLERQLNKYVDTFYFGGYDEAERCVAAFVPKFFSYDETKAFVEDNINDLPINMIRVKKDRFCSLSHRDYLGSIMGLGIKREMIGDIVTDEEGCSLFALTSICTYICENLKKIGRGTVECEVAELSDFVLSSENTEEKFYSVASLRIDNILSAAFGLSRNSAAEEIKKGTVYVNSLKCLKNDFLIKEKDKIVLRGKGKSVLTEVIGESKKGRVHIKIKKYK